MALILADRVRETSTTTGTGALSLAGAVVGYQTFSSAIGNTNTCYYAISNPGVAEFEVGIGTYATSGNTLTRTTILKSSNSNAAVNFSAGTKDVFVTYPATKSVYLDASGNVTLAGTLTANTIGAFTLGGTVAGGGNQLNNVIIGTTTPLAGAFTTLSATGALTGNTGVFSGVVRVNGASADQILSVKAGGGGNVVSIFTSDYAVNTTGSVLLLGFLSSTGNTTARLYNGINGGAGVGGIQLGAGATDPITIPGTLAVTGTLAAGATTVTGTLSATGNVGLGTTTTNISGGGANTEVLTVNAKASGNNAILELNGWRTGVGEVVSYLRAFNNAAATPIVDLRFVHGGSSTTGYLETYASGTLVTTTHSTGLAVTGTLSATQTISATGGSVSSVVDPAVAINYQRVLRFNDNSNTSWAGYILSTGTGLGIGGNTFVSLEVGGTTYAYINSSGNLGIGTTSPVANSKLTIDNGANSYGLVINSSASPGIKLSVSGTTNTYISGDATAFAVEHTNSILLRTNNADRVTINSSGNLGIGTVAPTARLHLYKAASNVYETIESDNGYNAYTNYRGYAGGISFGRDGGSGNFRWSSSVDFGGTQFMTLDTSGSLLLGPTSSTGLSGGDFAMKNASSIRFRNAADNAYVSALLFTSSNGLDIGSGGSLATITFGIAGVGEVGRFDTSGNLLVGTTSGTADKATFAAATTTTNVLAMVSTDNSSGGLFAVFRNSAYTSIGSIARVTTTNAVVYNTTSDYRLKTIVGAVTGQGERIDALKPINYQWTEGGQNASGFLAHEFQEVYASSVTGTKDAVDEDGNPIYQGMQAGTAEVIADLVAELQSLRKRITALEAK